MQGVKRIIIESYPVLIAASLISISGGVMLGSSKNVVASVQQFFAMMLVINATAGNLGSILGARLASALHLGTLEPKLRGQKLLKDNLAASAIQSLSVFSILGIVFYLLSGSTNVAAAFFISGAILSLTVMIMTVASAFVSYKGGLDPDNVVIPIITSVADVVGIMILLLTINIVGVGV